MKTVTELITHIRLSTENTDYDVTNNIGIMDSEFVQYLNDAQSRIQSLVVQQHSDVFSNEAEISCEGTRRIDIQAALAAISKPPMLISNKVSLVEYSSTGSESDYYSLEETSLRNRLPGASGSPLYYIRSSGNILLAPNPSAGKFRITYTQRLPKLVSGTPGTNEVNTSELPETAERYLIAYSEWKILKRDGSVDSIPAMQELASLEQEIVGTYRHIQEDVQTIPLINQYDDWSLD